MSVMTGVQQNQWEGVLFGTAVGDSLGLPGENLSARRLKALWRGYLRHRFVFGHGMCSDDTEHTILVCEALLASGGSVEEFERRLAWKLRWWLMGAPAGIGLATMRSIIKLWLGFSPRRSGVFSAGNGPAMRSAPLGVAFAHDPEACRKFVEASTRMTHTDPRALTGALAVAFAAAASVRAQGRTPDAAEMCRVWRSCAPDDNEWQGLVDQMENSLKDRLSVAAFAARLGLSRGVTGYMYHTVPLCLYAWLRHWGEYGTTVQSVIECGGDADTTGAIAGAMAGVATGPSGIPGDWIRGLWEFPKTNRYLEHLAAALAKQDTSLAPSLGVSAMLLPLRNLLFLLIVLIHVLRRCLPPY